MMSDSMLDTERNIGVKDSNQFDWLLPFNQAVQADCYWQLVLKGKLISRSTIDLTRSAAGLPLLKCLYE